MPIAVIPARSKAPVFDQRHRVEIGPLRLWRVTRHDEAAPHPGFTHHGMQIPFEIVL